MYIRKTYDCYVIEVNYGYGWEEVDEYTYTDYVKPLLSARKDAKEYSLSGCDVRITKHRRRIVNN